jgi:hypothetical protein
MSNKIENVILQRDRVSQGECVPLSRQHVMDKSATLTFCDVSENHVGMEKIGRLATHGISIAQLDNIENKCRARGINYQRVTIGCSDDKIHIARAYIFIIRNGVDILCNAVSTDTTSKDEVDSSTRIADLIYHEQYALPLDTMALMRNRVVNKRARYNLCFGPTSSEPDYARGKGTVIAFGDRIPLTTMLFNAIREFTEITDIATAEGNYYYKPSKCGIGFHGDSERRVVVAARFGVPFPLVYQWYHRGEAVGLPHIINLNHGDIYIMSDKAVGNDWKRKIIPTLRHAAGCSKYTGIH